MTTEATQQGADVKPGEVAVETRSARDIALEALDARQEEAHRRQIDDQLENDPGAALMTAQMVEQQETNRKQAIEDGLLPPDEEELKDGLVSKELMHPEQDLVSEADPDALPTHLENDPLANFIVMQEGKPMFTLKVNGENMLMPLEDAHRQLQIGTAAEIRMTNAAKMEQSINQRAAELTAGEQALAARMQVAQPVQPSVPAEPDLSEADIRKEALNVVTSVFSGTEEEATDKLTKALMKIRTPAATPAPDIDVDAIVRQASTAAVGALTAVDSKKDLVRGLDQFRNEYPEIMRDANLYRMADGMTDEIATDNPSWDKSQVMLEAGKRTRKWVDDLKGPAPTVENDGDETLTEVTSEQTLPPTQLRQDRKSGLVRMPQPAAAAVQDTSKAEEPRPLTPQEALDEVRRARGQAV